MKTHWAPGDQAASWTSSVINISRLCRKPEASSCLHFCRRGPQANKTNYSETPHQLNFSPPVPTDFSLVLARQEGANVTLAWWQQLLLQKKHPALGSIQKWLLMPTWCVWMNSTMLRSGAAAVSREEPAAAPGQDLAASLLRVHSLTLTLPQPW